MPEEKNELEVCGAKIIHQARITRAEQEDVPENELHRLAATYKVLGDPTRLRLVMALAGGEMCVCDLAAFLGFSDSAVSHHLRRLKDLALVKSRRDGQILFYELDDDHVAELLQIGLNHVREQLIEVKAMHFVVTILHESWKLLLDSSVYVIFGVVVAGLLRVFLNPGLVARHLSGGRFVSVFKAALLGVPLPLCSCGVLPAALSLKKQGANTGATTAFLISTPESGVDSIAVTYALMDPVMTVARPLAALATATAAGVLENLVGGHETGPMATPDLSCTIDGCCDGIDCPPEVHAGHHGLGERVLFGLKYAYHEVWQDMAPWFLFGLILAGLITALVPTEVMVQYLGGGPTSMLIMLAVGIPLYICATASTPIAAALVLKGVSPGAALVFLLAGPATNVTSLTVLVGTWGKRATAIYLASIAVFSVLFGLLLDQVYVSLGISPMAVVGQAAELIPGWLQWLGAILLLIMSVGPVKASLGRRLAKLSGHGHGDDHDHGVALEGPLTVKGNSGSCTGST